MAAGQRDIACANRHAVKTSYDARAARRVSRVCALRLTPVSFQSYGSTRRR
jgi:hypothetical protein